MTVHSWHQEASEGKPRGGTDDCNNVKAALEEYPTGAVQLHKYPSPACTRLPVTAATQGSTE